MIGAPVFRYYPFVAGDYLPQGTTLLQVTDDPDLSSKAPVGDSLVADARLFFEAVQTLVTRRPPSVSAPLRSAPGRPDMSAQPLAADAIMAAVRAGCPEDFVLGEEAPSAVGAMQDQFRIDKPDSFYTFASGGLGWDMPAAVGLALAERQSGRNRPVIALTGDGSFQYSPQALYTAAQQRAHVVFVVLQNHEYAILKNFAELEETPNVSGPRLARHRHRGAGQRLRRAGHAGEDSGRGDGRGCGGGQARGRQRRRRAAHAQTSLAAGLSRRARSGAALAAPMPSEGAASDSRSCAPCHAVTRCGHERT